MPSVPDFPAMHDGYVLGEHPHRLEESSPVHCARGSRRCARCKEFESKRAWVLYALDDSEEAQREARPTLQFRINTVGGVDGQESSFIFSPYRIIGKFPNEAAAQAWAAKHRDDPFLYVSEPCGAVQESDRLSYQEIHGPLPGVSVINEDGLAVQATGCSEHNPSYQQVHGPMPGGPVVNEDRLAVQSTGCIEHKPSYQEVHGPMPGGPVINEDDLAVQSTGCLEFR
eukprot:TRINITY_DN67209_c0_g1_i1.p1 TRINITY_DN67209_c0_g1~~TRINITY_DN67209_c0_g1_i1.p1  ORF type:complete len:227 (+),score=20.68 TRINITY_DN67209_c0_g1_i1:33-713(+)